MLVEPDFDVVFIDILYRPITEWFEHCRRFDALSVDGPFVQSGLAVLRQIDTLPKPRKPRAAFWTDGGDNRLLHMIWAYDHLNTNAFYYKDGDISAVEMLHRATLDLMAGRPHIAKELREEGVDPRRKLPTLREKLFRDPKWARIWRALALGATTHDAIERAIGDHFNYKRSIIPDMAIEADQMNPIPRYDQGPLAFCAHFASRHRLFFLDATVREMCP